MLPESLLMNWVNTHRSRDEQVRSVREMGLNRRRLRDFRSILIEASDLERCTGRLITGQIPLQRYFIS